VARSSSLLSRAMSGGGLCWSWRRRRAGAIECNTAYIIIVVWRKRVLSEEVSSVFSLVRECWVAR
jgi:hypothetical protein